MRLKKLTNWFKTVVSRTPEQMSIMQYNRYIRALNNNPVTSTTYRGQLFIGRNDPCYCGNRYAGRIWRDKNGNHILDINGKIQDRPVKFKHCCQRKHKRVTEETAK